MKFILEITGHNLISVHEVKDIDLEAQVKNRVSEFI